MTDDDTLTTRDLVPVSGGTWDGLLFDNPNIGLPAALTWSFRFPFAEVHREYSSSQIFLDVLPPGRAGCSPGRCRPPG